MFDRDRLETAFRNLGVLAYAEQKTIEIAVYGGSALMLTFDWRKATRDVDAVFDTDKEVIRRLSRIVAENLDLDENWINDGVKGFLSAADGEPMSKQRFATYPSETEPGLRVMVARRTLAKAVLRGRPRIAEGAARRRKSDVVSSPSDLCQPHCAGPAAHADRAATYSRGPMTDQSNAGPTGTMRVGFTQGWLM